MAGVALGPEHTSRGRTVRRWQRALWSRPGFGTAHPGPACQPDDPQSPRPREGPLGADAGYAGETPRNPLHGASQTRAQVTGGEPVWTQLLNPKHEPGVRLHGSSGVGYHL